MKLLFNLFVVLVLSAEVSHAEDSPPASLGVVAVDVNNGELHPRIRRFLTQKNFSIKEFRVPISKKGLRDVDLLLIAGMFKGSLKSPGPNETEHGVYSPDECEAVRHFVSEGGTLLGAARSWPWIYKAYGNKPLEDFPLNQIGALLGFEISGQCTPEEFHRSDVLGGPGDYKIPEGEVFSEVHAGSQGVELIISSNKNSACGLAAKRLSGHVVLFGHQAVLIENPSIVTILSSQAAERRMEKKNHFALKQFKERRFSSSGDESESGSRRRERDEELLRPLVTLSQETPNLLQWVAAPLRVYTPWELESQVILLREAIIDEGFTLPEGRRSAHKEAAILCSSIIAAFQERRKAQVLGRLKVARRTEDSELSNQALEARRNSLMSWPQYAREVEQREVLLQYREDAVETARHVTENKWNKKASSLKAKLLKRFQLMRNEMRKELHPESR